MAGSTNKKVVIRRFERETLTGFVNPQTFLEETGVELLSLGGSVAVIPYGDIKAVYFVRDLEGADPESEKRTFTSRPKIGGLWVRLDFRDGDFTEGLLTNNLAALDPHGFTILPPDLYSNTQRIFVPKSALTRLEVLGVVGSSVRRRKQKPPPPREQLQMFE